MKAFGFAEHGSVFEWVHKKNSIEEAGMKYIHGCECYLTAGIEEKINDNYHVILIAKNFDGKNELNTLVSKSFNRKDGHFYSKPRITMDELINTSDNIIVTSACLGGILHGTNEDLRDRFIGFLKNNKSRCFLEIQHHPFEEQCDYNVELAFLSKTIGVPLIAGTDTHSIDEEHAASRAILQKAKKVHFESEDQCDLVFKSYDELCAAYEKQGALPPNVYLEAIENTNVLANMIEPFTLDKGYKYPDLYDDPEKVFKQKIYQGIKERGIDKYDNYDEYIQRIKEEIETFKHNNAIDFMLLDEDYKRHCREIGIGYGPARGSVSGSIVAYCLHITDIDSIKEHLNFSRFMNVERVSLADIDTDFYEKDIPKVKDYLYNKEKLFCCDIITFNTVALKGAIRDVGRALEIPLDTVADICKRLDTDYEKLKEEYPELFRWAESISGTIVSVGNHPAGVVVSPFPLNDWFGTFTSSTDEYPISQINMKEVESLNFVKLDLLRLDNVGAINEACDLAHIERLNPNNTPDDIEVWKDIRDDTTCIFQWESESASRYLKQLFSDETIKRIKEVNPNMTYMDLLSVGNGAIRPAGASYRNDLAKGVFHDNGHEALNEMLKPTLGFLVYQEQVIEFLHRFCGYSMGQADIVRRGFAKKTGTEKFIPDIKAGFIKTMKEKYNTAEEKSEELIVNFLQVIKDASEYLFSENHAKPYSWIGYICGYLRHYYPLEFLTAELNAFDDDIEKTISITNCVRKRGIKLCGIKFRKSKDKYFCDRDTNSIYKGLMSVKGLGQGIGDNLYTLKDKKYVNFAELLVDLYELKIGRGAIDILIKLDYFKEFGEVGKLLATCEYYYSLRKRSTLKKAELNEQQLKVASACAGKETAKQFSNVDINKFIIETADFVTPCEFTFKERMDTEYELLGYVDYVNPKLNKVVYILDVNTRYSPLVTMYSLSKGQITQAKLKKKIFEYNKIAEKDLIKIDRFEKKNKTRFDDGKYIAIPGTVEWWINSYKKVVI